MFPVINPTNMYYLAWDILIFVASLFSALFIPLLMNRMLELTPLVQNSIMTCLTIIFSLQIVVQMNLCFFQYGSLVDKRIEIIFHYIKNNFLMDALLLISFVTLNDSHGTLISTIRELLILYRLIFR